MHWNSDQLATLVAADIQAKAIRDRDVAMMESTPIPAALVAANDARGLNIRRATGVAVNAARMMTTDPVGAGHKMAMLGDWSEVSLYCDATSREYACAARVALWAAEDPWNALPKEGYERLLKEEFPDLAARGVPLVWSLS